MILRPKGFERRSPAGLILPPRSKQRGLITPALLGVVGSRSRVVTDPYYANVSLLLHLNSGQNTGIIDNSANAYSPATSSIATSATQSKFGGASGSFVGGGIYASYTSTTPLDLTTGDWTIEAQVYFNSTTGNQTITVKSTSTGFYPWLLWKNGTSHKFEAYFYDTTNTLIGSIVGTTVATTGTWYGLQLRRSGNTFALAVNGSQEGSITSSASLRTNSSDPVWIGGFGGNSSTFNGYLDEYRMTKGVARTFAAQTAEFPNS